LIFFVTDGETSGVGNSERNVLLNKLQREKNSLIMGIGIGRGISQSIVKEAYPLAAWVPEVENLPLEFINIFRGIIHR